jgi:hypothetical protein
MAFCLLFVVKWTNKGSCFFYWVIKCWPCSLNLPLKDDNDQGQQFHPLTLILGDKVTKRFNWYHKYNHIVVMNKHVDIQHIVLISTYVLKKTKCPSNGLVDCEPVNKWTPINPVAIFWFLIAFVQFKIDHETQLVI